MIHAAAIQYQGKVYTMPAPARHVDVFVTILKDHDEITFENGERGGVKGFITDTGEFLNRQQAGAHALACGQVNDVPGGELYSEMVW